jgi:PTS system nitrogen regulatory IIA component
MLDEDLDIDGLAAFLHLSPAQVSRLADRGKLPGRKVAGQWRFSPAEIHHWMENRIGLSGEEELVQVEGVLDRASPADEEAPRIAELLPLEAIEVPLRARTRNSVITEIVEVAARTHWLWDAAKAADAVRAREEMHPTALETGVALLHPRRPMAGILGQPFLAFGRTASGIPFGGGRGTLTDLFFLILSVEDRGHLRVLARLSRLINDLDFLAELRAAPDAAATHAAIRRREEQVV